MVEEMESGSNGECSEEELSVLPRHTKVVVTGNNRTKSVLVGLQGVVKKAVGLGGWHWLVLTNGIEVKLQRNALSVIEAPTGQEEEEEDIECVNMQWNGPDIVSDDVQNSHRPRHRSHKIVGPTPKNLCRSRPYHSKSKEQVSSGKLPKVNLSKLETTTLSRYRRYFNLLTECCVEQADGAGSSKELLVEAVQRHFMSHQLDELQVIVGFIKAAKRLKNVSN